MDYVLLVAGLALVIKGADWLVRGASSVAMALQVSDLVIGLTVVSFGTSLPELVIGLVAGGSGNGDMFIGNIIGSNIANIFLILGVAAMICPLPANRGTVWHEIPFTLGAAIIFFFLLNDRLFDGDATSRLGHIDGVVLLGFFCAFMYYILHLVKDDKDKEWLGEPASDPLLRSIIEIVAGIAGLIIGGRMAVHGAEQIALAWGLSQAFIGLTVIAIGTSLPELATSGMAAYRKNVDIAVGNVVGSNIFNIFIVAGITSVFHSVEYNEANNVDMGVMLVASLILFVLMFTGRKPHTLQRKEGAVLVTLYVVYMGYLINRG